MTRTTIREYLCDLRSQFAHIDALVFTSFTFDGGFFENNVLPSLLDIDEKNEVRRRTAVNEALAATECCVFYDGNNRASISGKYHYQVVPIQLPDRSFHPKNVIMAGQNKYGINMVIVTAASANLTLSGWGKQEEVISDIYIESSRMEDQIGVLKKFLSFIQERSRKRSLAVQRINTCLDGLSDIPRTQVDHSTDLYFGGLKGVQPFARILLDERDGHRWDELYIVSPYWHDVANQMERFPCHSYVLIPAKGYPSTEDNKQRYGITLSHLDEVVAKFGEDVVDLKDLSAPRNSPWLFRHAKAYFAVKNKRLRAGIGSCNFTDAALSGEKGNIESMIVTDLHANLLDEFKNDLKNIKIDKLEDFETEETDDLPQRLPFIIFVDFDWKARVYSYTIDILNECAVRDIVLFLPGVDNPITIGDTRSEGVRSLSHPFQDIRNYRVTYIYAEQKLEHIGPVFEFNIDHTEKIYTPIPKVDQIFQSWSSLDGSAIGPIGPQGDNGDSGDGELIQNENETEISTKPIDDVLSYYDIYRAFYELRSKISVAASEKDNNKILLYLERRSDSVKCLSKSLEDIKDPLRKYLILNEISEIAAEYRRYLTDDCEWLENVKREVETLEQQLTASISNEMTVHGYPAEKNAADMLTWFKTKFNQ